MKNWKKLISGVVAMMAVATAVSATPAKVPVEVLDVADATGIAVDEVSVTTKAADNEGTWYFAKGNSKGEIGEIAEIENGVKIRHTSTSRNAELSAGYTTDSLYTYADTKVQFSYMVTEVREKNSQLIQVSSGKVLQPQPSFPGVAECGGMDDGKFKYYNNSAIIQVSSDGIKYLDPVSGELKKVDVDLKADTEYNFRFENIAGTGTYDLYIDEVKIGANSTPVAEDIALLNPTIETLNSVRVWLESGGIADDVETEEDERKANSFSVNLSDISFLESKPTSVEETFDTLPAAGSTVATTALDEKFDYADLAEMQAAGWTVTVPTDINATAGITDGKFMSTMTKALTQREEHYIIAEKEIEEGVNGNVALAAGLGLHERGRYTSSNSEVALLDKNGTLLASVMLKTIYGDVDKPAFVLTVGTESKQIFLSDYALQHDGTIYNIYLVSDKRSNIVKLYVDDVSTPIITFEGKSINGVKKVKMSQFQKSYTKWTTDSSAYFDNIKLTSKGDGWTHYIAMKNGNPDAGTISAADNLVINYNTGKNRGGSLFSSYKATELANEKSFEVSYDFIPYVTPGKVWSSYTLYGNDENKEIEVKYGEEAAVVGTYYDSIQIAVLGESLVYGCSDENGNYFKEIPGVEFENNKKYYLKIKVDSVAGTYTMWLSDEVITSETAPVVENETFFLPSGTVPSDWNLIYKLQRYASGQDEGTITVDNLVIKRSAKDSFAVMNDDQQYMTSLGTSKYIDLINVPADKKVIVAYYDAENKLVDVEVATGDSLRAIKADETAVSALVMTWEDFDNIVPVNAAIELK